MLVQASAFGSWLHRLARVFMFFLCLYFLPSCFLSGIPNKFDLILLTYIYVRVVVRWPICSMS